MAIRLARAAIRGLLRFAANPLNSVDPRGDGSAELEVKGANVGEMLLLDNDDVGGGKGAEVSVPEEVG